MNPSRFQYDLFRFLAPAAAVFLLFLLAESLKGGRRRGIVVPSFALFTLGTILYLLANTFEICSHSRASSLFWSRAIYVGVGYLPILWYEFCARFSRRKRGLPLPLLALALLLPTTTLVVVFSDKLMHLMWSGIQWVWQEPYYISLRTHGPWFYVHTAYTYGFFIAGATILLRSIILYRNYYRRQAAFIIAAVSICLSLSLVYILNPIPRLVKDFTPMGYAVAVSLFYYALFRRDLFALAPTARGFLVERMSDAVLVLDEAGRLADANPSAMLILGFGEERLGLPFAPPSPEPSLAGLPDELVDAVRARASGRFCRGEGEDKRWYAADVTVLEKAGSCWNGALLVVIHDETEAHNLLARVEALARTDELTGLANRRYFMEVAIREIARAARHGGSLAVAMFDLDRFKKVNDTYGHQTGDRVLALFGRIMSEEIRSEDFVGRIGGEEFALIMTADAEGARAICERVRTRVQRETLADEIGKAVRFTVSAGFAIMEEGRASLDDLLSAADAALYRAKEAGRNRVEMFR
jgi:diguanylate cyclase (GGDEF)-like protein